MEQNCKVINTIVSIEIIIRFTAIADETTLFSDNLFSPLNRTIDFDKPKSTIDEILLNNKVKLITPYSSSPNRVIIIGNNNNVTKETVKVFPVDTRKLVFRYLDMLIKCFCLFDSS